MAAHLVILSLVLLFVGWPARVHARGWLGITIDTRGESGYELLGRYRMVGPPVWIWTSFAYDDPGHGAWVRASAFGGRIIEHGGGIISSINSIFLSGAGGRQYRNVSTGEVKGDGVRVGNGKEASWAFDISDDYVHFQATSMIMPVVGWKVGFWDLRNIRTDARKTQLEMDDPTYQLLDREGGVQVQNAAGFEMNLIGRLPLRVPVVGRAAFELEAPIVYMIIAPVVFFGGFDESARGSARAFGVPRLSLSVNRSIGPVRLRAAGSVPTAFMVIPWYFEGAELNLEAGFFF